MLQVKLEAMTLYVKAPGDPLPEDMGTDEDTTLSYFAVQVCVLAHLMSVPRWIVAVLTPDTKFHASG